MLRCELCGEVGPGPTCKRCGTPLNASSGPVLPGGHQQGWGASGSLDATQVAPGASGLEDATIIAPLEAEGASDTYRATGRMAPVTDQGYGGYPPQAAASYGQGYAQQGYAQQGYPQQGYEAAGGYPQGYGSAQTYGSPFSASEATGQFAYPGQQGYPQQPAYGYEPQRTRSKLVPIVATLAGLAVVGAGAFVVSQGMARPAAPASTPKVTRTVTVSADTSSPVPTITQTPTTQTSQPPVTQGPSKAAQECAVVSPADPGGCTKAYQFLSDYAAIDDSKTMSRNDLANWWTEPADYYGSVYTLDALQKELTKPTTSGTTYLGGRLLSYNGNVAVGNVSGAQVMVRVPYIENNVSKSVDVIYLLVPGPGANPYRITKCYEK